MKSGLALVLGSLVVALAACTAAGDDLGSQEQNAEPIDRLIMGRASQYPADLTLREKAPVFAGSMAERRKLAWDIFERVTAPVGISASAPSLDTEPSIAAPIANALTLPRFQTWHAREEILPMFNQLFKGLSVEDRASRAPFSAEALQAIFPWNVTRATTLASFTQERLDQRRAELNSAAGVASLGKDPRVLMSPDYVQHLFESYSKILNCKTAPPIDPKSGTAPTDPATSEAFAPCLNGEFPAGAVAVKSRWMPNTSAVPVYDTSADALKARLVNGSFPEQGDSQATPDPTQAYTMQLTPDTQSRLVALHIMTKELRDWVWITVWWSPSPDTDFGADRPASITGPFANYKMCVVTAYDEADARASKGAPKSLADAIDVMTNDAGPATWCSNPYLETAEHSVKTNCIGCHQHGGTRETTDTILAGHDTFPDNSRKRVRNDFPADYIFTTEGGLELAAEFKNRVEAISPTPIPAK